MAIHFGYDPERKKLTEIESIGGEFLFELVLHEMTEEHSGCSLITCWLLLVSLIVLTSGSAVAPFICP